MTWESKTLNSILPGPFAQLASAANTAANGLDAVATVLNTAVTLVKAFQTTTSDPFFALVNALISDAEDLLNDTFGAGFFLLLVTPYTIESPTYDITFKIPTLTPAQALTRAQQSFDDQGDLARPQFTDSATVTGFGIMATAVSPDILLEKVQGLLSLMNLKEFNDLYDKYNKAIQVHDDPTSVIRSRQPDWTSIRLQDIPPFGDLYKQMKGYLNLFKGYATTANNATDDFLNTLTRKITAISQQATALSDAIDAVIGGLGASGVYWLDIAPTGGGNTYLKASLPDSTLQALTQNKYTVMALFVAGGPGVDSLETFKSILS